MKHPRRLTLKEKRILAKEGHDPNKYLRIKRTPEYLEFINIETKKDFTSEVVNMESILFLGFMLLGLNLYLEGVEKEHEYDE